MVFCCCRMKAKVRQQRPFEVWQLLFQPHRPGCRCMCPMYPGSSHTHSLPSVDRSGTFCLQVEVSFQLRCKSWVGVGWARGKHCFCPKEQHREGSQLEKSLDVWHVCNRESRVERAGERVGEAGIWGCLGPMIGRRPCPQDLGRGGAGQHSICQVPSPLHGPRQGQSLRHVHRRSTEHLSGAGHCARDLRIHKCGGHKPGTQQTPPGWGKD